MSADGVAAPHDGLALPQRALAFATMGMAVAMSVLDSTIVNVALPSIAAELRLAPADAVWLVTAYQLGVTVSLLPLATLGERLGYRTVYLGGLALFTAASGLCAVAPGLWSFTAMRALQGVGAAGIMSVNIALVRFIYPHALLGRGIAKTAVVVAVSGAAGPTIGALILSAAPWQWLFLVNVPIGIAALALGFRTLPDNPRSPSRFDLRSVLLNAVALGCLISGIDSLSDGRAARSLVELGVAAASGCVFIRRQLRLPAPMLPVDLLRRPVFSLSILTSICSFTAQMLSFVALPFFFHDRLGHGAVGTGLLMTPWPATVAVVAPLSGRLADRLSLAKLTTAGLLMMGAGLISLIFLPQVPSTVDIVWRLVLCGAGFGLFQPPNNKAIITSAPRERSGGASGMQATARLIGQSLGAAFAALILGLAGAGQIPYAMALAAALSLAGAAASIGRRFDQASET